MKAHKPLKILAVALATIFFISCKPDYQFSIEGTINVDETDTWIYLHKLWSDVPSIDSVPIENGYFHFTGIIQDPDLYALSIPSYTREACTFILEPAELTIQLDYKQLYNDGTSVSGGPINEEFNRQHKYQEESYYNAVKSLLSVVEPVDKGRQRVVNDKIMELRRTNSVYVSNYIQDNANSPVSMYLLIWWYYHKPLVELNEVLYAFSPKLRNTSVYKKFGSNYNISYP